MEDPRSYKTIGERARDFEFFQLVRLLAGRQPGGAGPGTGFDYRSEPLRVRPDANHVFPSADVREVKGENDPDGVPEVTVTFGGLYGIDSPLPYAFQRRIAAEPGSDSALRSFLDLFSHRLYTLLWRAWARYRPELFDGSTRARQVHEGRLHALAGMGTPGAAPAPLSESVLLALSGRLSAWSRNAEGLRVLLELSLGLPVRIEENVVRRVELPHRPRVGSSRLGRDAVAGSRVRDASGHFRIEIGPLAMDQFLDLLPGHEGASRVDALVRLYAPDYLDYDMRLILESANVPPLRLGESRSASLGLTTCVGTPRTPHLHRTVRYAA
jgi:type VI secretion system protein ImpH